MIGKRKQDDSLVALLENGHWLFPDSMLGKDCVGFVYAIVNKDNGRYYIGKKYYHSRDGKKVSNWKTYITSSKEVSNDIVNMGRDRFDFICLEEYTTKGSISFAEAWTIAVLEGLHPDSLCYNKSIDRIFWKVKEKITKRHKERLKHIEEYGLWVI